MNEDIFSELKGKKLKAPKGALIAIVIIAILMVVLMLNPFVKIDAGHRGVLMNFGAVQDNVLGEGLHLIVPVMQKVYSMNVQVQKTQTEAKAASADIQDTNSTIALNYHIEPEKANWVYQHIGTQYKDRIIDPAVQEVVKSVTAKYTATDLITKREQVSSDMKEQLKERLIRDGITVDGFAIVDFSFSKQFSDAIEAKQTAEQLALKAQRDLDRIKIEKQQKITQAQAEAEALRLQRQNISRDLIRLRQVEAVMKAIDKWDGHMPKVTSGAVPFIDVKSFDQE